MCGIYALIYSGVLSEFQLQNIVKNKTELLLHRGPDSQNHQVFYTNNNKTILLLHTRLQIIGDSTPQPLTDANNEIFLIINGEIFNWRELSQELGYACPTSDCEIIIGMYLHYIRDRGDYQTFFSKINGQFSFVLYDTKNDHLFVSRDHIGITPLYYGQDNVGSYAFASEMKCLTNGEMTFSNVKTFNPRRFIHSKPLRLIETREYLDYYTLETNQNLKDVAQIKQTINEKLTNAVHRQLRDVVSLDFGVLLSGGLDSSLIASIIAKNIWELYKVKIKTFSIGVDSNSADIIAARQVAKYINSEHYEYYFTTEEGLKSIPDVIWYTETYDTTSVRASTAMYLLTKKIKKQFPNLRVLFSGELSDELLCYLYGSNAPTLEDYQLETKHLVSNVHRFDCLRANKTCMANSIEVRVPFTDPDFVKYILSIPPQFKCFGALAKRLYDTETMEKQILRDSFTDNYLPHEILYRKKEQFSDGVSNFTDTTNTTTSTTKTNWIESLKEFAEKHYSDEQFDILIQKYSYNRPETKEQLFFREIFCRFFNNYPTINTRGAYTNTSELTVKFWEPKWSNTKDPSARQYSKEQFN
jgi:asparagine synthase (glutamine-hydrolysing)